METITRAPVAIRALGVDDLDAVVAIDAAQQGRSRRAYIERRLQSALREPTLHAQLAAVDDQRLAGFMLGRVLEGEFGRRNSGLRLELLGVRADLRGQRVGARLFDALAAWGRRHGVHEMRTTAAWRDTALLHWLATVGFELSPVTVVERAVEHAADGAQPLPEHESVALERGQGPGHEIDFGAHESNDFERQARGHADVRAMTPDDLAEIVRIDRAITGRDRSGYIGRRLMETISDSAIRVSLAARLDGAVVGYLMARVDWGDFGRVDPVAVIDTIGVDPEYAARRGVGRAMLRQLFANLDALHVERVETLISCHDLPTAGFFTGNGFEPAQRLALVRRLDG
ncbi:MAG TPA: GNAT family N-acetyltransferase [Burkholderiaceae bacterium]|nr:GNAT family N-acetyltransferase [Burkholderiaceae bacterium]